MQGWAERSLFVTNLADGPDNSLIPFMRAVSHGLITSGFF